MYRRRNRAARAALAGAVVAGTLASVLAVGAPAEAGTVRQAHTPAAAPTPAPNLTALRTALQSVVKAGAPGVFAQVQDGYGAKTYTVSTGKGDLATNTAVNPAGEFRVGSITKNFTAVLVLQLVAQKKVDLDALASRYLPAGLLPKGSPITVRELLNHTSGLYDYTDDLLTGDTVTGYQGFRYKTYTPQSLVADSVKHGPQFTPGKDYSYSNTNFVVLGLLVEHVTGLPYATVLHQRILDPLHLTHTYFVVPQTTVPGVHALGYLTQDNPAKPLFDATDQTASWLWTAGALISSTSDLNTYLRALTTGHLLPAAQLAQMETTEFVNSTTRYGLGLREYQLPCGTDVYGHDGIIEGYQTYSYTTKNGSRQVTISANASNNTTVYAAELRALTPVFCGTSPAPARAHTAAAANATQIAHEEARG
ncbi:beta-lactamase family protein [Streptacidiphilus sp. PB12-B1b]|uniref:serine hydrolase domain-containing protein n=1 Tax=Streptacidiphilus sp. PB12-B1b TaxID=2705012 RepID=UPI0015FC8DC1|nr:serine hydrolase domain-containing protein [Streptacidiphilus sp. PB12-B1b]QMU78076.1 beta-lactamase family protein [Streptacidiphilus sp. PB12-B1b]